MTSRSYPTRQSTNLLWRRYQGRQALLQVVDDHCNDKHSHTLRSRPIWHIDKPLNNNNVHIRIPIFYTPPLYLQFTIQDAYQLSPCSRLRICFSYARCNGSKTFAFVRWTSCRPPWNSLLWTRTCPPTPKTLCILPWACRTPTVYPGTF